MRKANSRPKRTPNIDCFPTIITFLFNSHTRTFGTTIRNGVQYLFVFHEMDKIKMKLPSQQQQ